MRITKYTLPGNQGVYCLMIEADDMEEAAVLASNIGYLKGRMELAPHLAEVYNFIKQHDDCSIMDIAEHLKLADRIESSGTLLNNRVAKLYDMGLLNRTRHVHSSGGSYYRYSARKPSCPPQEIAPQLIPQKVMLEEL